MTNDKIGQLLAEGNKIEAIQLLVKQEGYTLKEAKDYVERYSFEYEMGIAVQVQNEEEKQKSPSSLLWAFLSIPIMTIVLLFLTAPLLCRYSEVLQGQSGVLFWLFLHTRFILLFAIINVLLWWEFINPKNKSKRIQMPIISLLFLTLFIFTNGDECVRALKDLVREPIEITVTDYKLENMYLTGEHRRIRFYRICYRAVLEEGQAMERIMLPRKVVHESRDTRQTAPPPIDHIVIQVYPNTGIIADKKGLDLWQDMNAYRDRDW